MSCVPTCRLFMFFACHNDNFVVVWRIQLLASMLRQKTFSLTSLAREMRTAMSLRLNKVFDHREVYLADFV